MLRLAHRILSQNAFVLDAAAKCNQQRAQALMEATRKDLREGLPIIIADNVGEYVMHCEDKASIAFGNLPPAPPPFPNCFVEWLAPSHQRIATGQMISAAESGVLQFGCSLVNVGDGNSASQTLDEFENLTEEERYSTAHVFFGLLCASRRESGRIQALAEYYLLVSTDGRLIRAPIWFYDGGDGVPGERHLEIITLASTFAFMACRNAQLTDVTEEIGPTPKWCRRQRVPELKYHAVQIDPNMGAKPRAGERKTEGDRSGKALHICRGHFAHFRDDGLSQGLFGRRRFGTFWIPAHTRGSLEHGKVISTYNVKTLA